MTHIQSNWKLQKTDTVQPIRLSSLSLLNLGYIQLSFIVLLGGLVLTDLHH